MNELNYGTVQVIKGKHKNKIGYYDDDEGPKCVVYFDEPFLTKPTLIDYRSIQNVDLKHLPTEKFKLQNPELCKKAGIL